MFLLLQNRKVSQDSQIPKYVKKIKFKGKKWMVVVTFDIEKHINPVFFQKNLQNPILYL